MCFFFFTIFYLLILNIKKKKKKSHLTATSNLGLTENYIDKN